MLQSARLKPTVYSLVNVEVWGLCNILQESYTFLLLTGATTFCGNMPTIELYWSESSRNYLSFVKSYYSPISYVCNEKNLEVK